MKNIKIIIRSLFSLALLALIVVGCEDDEYVAPGFFTDLSITWSSGASSARESEVNRFFSFMDMSAGVESTEWIIPSNAFFLKGPIPNNLDNHDDYVVNPGDTVSMDKTVHVLWKKGDSLTKVRYRGVFKDSTSFLFNKYYDVALKSDVPDTIKTVRINGKWVADYTFFIDVYDTVVAIPEIRYPNNAILDHKTVNTVTVNFGDKLVFEDLSGLQLDNNARPNTTRWRMHTTEEEVIDQTSVFNKTTTRVGLRDKVIDTIAFNNLGEYRVELKVTRERTERVKANDETYDIPTVFKVIPLTVPLAYAGQITESSLDVISVNLSHKIQPLTGSVSGGFSVKVDGVTRAIKSVTRNSTGTSLLITLEQSLEPEDAAKVVTLSYNGSGTIKSYDERPLAAFSNVAIVVYEPTPIKRLGTISKSYLDDLLLITFDQLISPASIIGSLNPTKGFEVKVNGSVFTVQSVSVDPTNNKNIRLKVNGELYRNDVITVAYTGPGDIRSVGDGRIANFTAVNVFIGEDNILGSVGQFENAIGIDWLHTAFTGDGDSYTTTPPVPSVVTSVVPTGKVMRMTASDGSKPNTITVASFPFENGVKYRVKFKRYLGLTTTTESAKIYIGAQQLNADTWNSATDKLGQWQWISIDFVAATTSGAVRIQPIPVGIADVYYDDFIVQKVDDRP